MTALDLKRESAALYQPAAGDFSLVEVPIFHFLMIDGTGDPNTASAYSEAVQALYAAAYGIKFAVKKRQGIDYRVLPLEGLWWTDPIEQFSLEQREGWHWTMMIRQPEPWVSETLVGEILSEVLKKKQLPALERLRFGPYTEGLSVQIMHRGPYAAEAPTIARMHAWIAAQGYVPTGRHHEIYLSDPNRTAPEKMRTILRQPIGRA